MQGSRQGLIRKMLFVTFGFQVSLLRPSCSYDSPGTSINFLEEQKAVFVLWLQKRLGFKSHLSH